MSQHVHATLMALQQRAPRTIHLHFARSAARVLILAAGDVASFTLLRGLLHWVRSGGIGAGLAQLVGTAFPTGYLGGWRYAAALVVGLMVTGTYGRGDRRRDPKRVFAGVALATALALWANIWEVGLASSAVHFVASVAAVWTVIALERAGIDALVTRFLPRKHAAERSIFVGDPDDVMAASVASRLVKAGGIDLLGWVSTDRQGQNGNGNGNGAGQGWVHKNGHARNLGTAEDFWRVLHASHADTVVLCGNIEDADFESVVEAASVAGCRILAISRYEGPGKLRPSLVWERGVPLVELTVPALRAQQMMVKRVIDIVGAVLGLLVLSPVLTFFAIAVKVDSPGPVFFSSERVGLGGRVFRMLKFRTMRDGADAEKESVAHLNHSGDNRLFKIPNDPRITRLGAWLRRWSLDELPQLWNVLRGDMSLVGPRPFFEADLSEYSDHHFSRLGAKPGITGLWQVKGRSEVVEFEEVVRLDREYIDSWSLWLDCKILALTIPAVTRRTGAY